MDSNKHHHTRQFLILRSKIIEKQNNTCFMTEQQYEKQHSFSVNNRQVGLNRTRYCTLRSPRLSTQTYEQKIIKYNYVESTKKVERNANYSWLEKKVRISILLRYDIPIPQKAQMKA